MQNTLTYRVVTLAFVMSATCAWAGSGLVVDKSGVVVRDTAGECWKTKDHVGPANGNCSNQGTIQTSNVEPLVPVATKREKPIATLVYFSENKSALDNADKARLKTVAHNLRNLPAGKKIVVEGYADPIGTAKYNQALSLRRAEEAKKILMGEGIPAAKIEAKAEGESHPVIDARECKGKNHNGLVDCLKADRRADIYIR